MYNSVQEKYNRTVFRLTRIWRCMLNLLCTLWCYQCNWTVLNVVLKRFHIGWCSKRKIRMDMSRFLFSRALDHFCMYRVTQKTGTFEKPNKNWRNPRKTCIDRNWTITTCLLRDSNPNYQCLKITSCRWRPPPRTHYFTAPTKLN